MYAAGMAKEYSVSLVLDETPSSTANLESLGLVLVTDKNNSLFPHSKVGDLLTPQFDEKNRQYVFVLMEGENSRDGGVVLRLAYPIS